jgi:hypothetical protein
MEGGRGTGGGGRPEIGITYREPVLLTLGSGMRRLGLLAFVFLAIASLVAVVVISGLDTRRLAPPPKRIFLETTAAENSYFYLKAQAILFGTDPELLSKMLDEAKVLGDCNRLIALSSQLLDLLEFNPCQAHYALRLQYLVDCRGTMANREWRQVKRAAQILMQQSLFLSSDSLTSCAALCSGEVSKLKNHVPVFSGGIRRQEMLDDIEFLNSQAGIFRRLAAAKKRKETGH